MDGAALLSSMVAPVVLINADGLFILSTSQRLSRQVDRLRRLAGSEPEAVSRTAWRAELLHGALSAQYAAMCLFTAAVFAAAARRALAAALALLGVAALFFSCVLVILESRASFQNVRREARDALQRRAQSDTAAS